ncbi:inhibitor of cysteine peptidase [Methanohalophilus levihalophilus]|uniref:protease inhibitor I42 family protein n=1 Tax=Methanohalophilus levihalophilus TaxID=1431282 RepID=UPI001AE380B3|nr:protease inhibitor I42 family protein [Methanohalophilus levihalophilus]MBP2030860.1 inhibitor of cysteine peptidase [Methanohalophilus levihalophilus]
MKINGYATIGLIVMVFIVALAAVVLPGCTEPVSPIDDVDDNGTNGDEFDDSLLSSFYNETDDSSTITIEVGDSFEVWLEENPTTGYQWELTVSDGLEIIKDEFIQTPEEEELVGSGGVHVWTIGINEAGDQSIDGIYKRPWEDTTGDEDTFSMAVIAVNAGDDQEGDFISGTAVVEDVQVLILESFPVQVHLSVSGYLPDGCTEVYEDGINEQRDGFNYTVEIPTKRPADMACTEAIVPYTVNVPIDVYGIEKGTYTVDVNGVQTTFELQMDNIIE